MPMVYRRSKGRLFSSVTFDARSTDVHVSGPIALPDIVTVVATLSCVEMMSWRSSAISSHTGTNGGQPLADAQETFVQRRASCFNSTASMRLFTISRSSGSRCLVAS